MTVGLATSMANALVDDLAGTVWVQLHTGSPGAAGTSNVATENTRQQAFFDAAVAGIATTNTEMEWVSVAATETYSYVSMWDDVTAGAFLASDQLDSARAVTANDNFTLAAGDANLALGPVAA